MYATKQQLAAYLLIEESALPPEVDKLVARAGDLIDYATMGRVDSELVAHTDAVAKAVCAQVESWLEVGDDADLSAMPQSFSIGSFSMTQGTDLQSSSPLAPRARRILVTAGLMSRKVSRRIYPTLAEQFFQKPWSKW